MLLDAYHLTIHALSAALLTSAAFVLLSFAQLIVFAVFHMRLFITVWNADTFLHPQIRQFASGSYVRMYLWVRERKIIETSWRIHKFIGTGVVHCVFERPICLVYATLFVPWVLGSSDCFECCSKHKSASGFLVCLFWLSSKSGPTSFLLSERRKLSAIEGEKEK